MNPQLLIWIGLILVVGSTVLVGVFAAGSPAQTATLVAGFVGIAVIIGGMVMMKRAQARGNDLDES